MVTNFELALNPTSIIITSVVIFYWAQGLALLYLSHMERHILKQCKYSQTKYVWNYYTKEEFNAQKQTSENAITYNIYRTFYDAGILVVIVIFEAFKVMWQLSERIGSKLKLREESLLSALYLQLLRTLYLIIFFPLNILQLKVTNQKFGGLLYSLMWFYIRDLILIFIFTIPAFYLIKNVGRNIIILISAAYFFWIIAAAAINFDFITSLEPLEDGLLRKTLEENVLPEINFSIDDIYHSNGFLTFLDEVNEKVYLRDKWIRKALVITGPLPIDKNVSLIGDTHGSVHFTTKEVIALIVYRIGESSRGYIFSTVSSTQVHLFTMMLACKHLYEREYILRMAGFRRNKPLIANLLVVWFFVIQPYWSFVYNRWKYIYDFTQLTEAQFMVSRFSLQKELISALVKVYLLNKEFPYHDYWYAIFNGYRRPLDSLVISMSPPDVRLN